MNSAASPWTAQQRRWLQALGHAVWRVGGDDAVAEDPAPTAVAPQPPVRAASRPMTDAHPVSDAPIVRRHTPLPAPASDAPAPALARGTGRRPSPLPDRLRLALLRASGLDPSDPATQEAMAQWPVERLRGDGAAKRAFWPQLRALRRRR